MQSEQLQFGESNTSYNPSKQVLSANFENWMNSSLVMSLKTRSQNRFLLWTVALLCISHGIVSPTIAQDQVAVTMIDGMVFEGRVFPIGGFGPNPASMVKDGNRPILMIDDGLRRVFVSERRHVAIADLERAKDVFPIWQKQIFKGPRNIGIGPIMNEAAFSEYGRRIITMLGPSGSRESYVQGITEVTPNYVKVEGLKTQGKDRAFDMRLATSSIDRKVLAALLRRQVSDTESVTERGRLIAFFVKANMFEEAEAELDALDAKFEGLKKENSEKRETLRIQIHRRALEEIRFRFDAGQVKLASELWQAYPEKSKIPGEIGAEFLELKTLHIDPLEQKLKTTLAKIKAIVNLAVESDDFEAPQKHLLQTFVKEVELDLNEANVDRFATFIRFFDDEALGLQQKVAYAVSSWFLGSSSASSNFAEAQALPLTRSLIVEYLTTADVPRRAAILGELKTMETGTPKTIADIIFNIKPLFPPKEGTDLLQPMQFDVKVVGTKKQKSKVTYHVQLPPEYNPHKKYPCVLSLPDVRFDAKRQLTWWTGSFLKNLKVFSGPASRHGYIVISPQWWSAKQTDYEYSIHEHDCVLASLQDAKRRFAIDTDRVFLSGHFKGGDAAWDIGLAHPDLWAGVIPISGRPDKYVLHYHTTAENNNLPFYIVTGDHDYGIRASKSGDHSNSVFFMTLERWLMKKDVDLTLIEYQGRGPEDYYEEVHHIFRWMKNKKRKWVPQNFSGRALRSSDNFFWNYEIGTIPAKNIVSPLVFDDVKKDTFKILVEQQPTPDPTIGVKFYMSPSRSGENVTLWLGPEFVDFEKLIVISGRGSFKKAVQPNRRVLLEDVRLRGDRQHPFWAKLTCAVSRWVVEDN